MPRDTVVGLAVAGGAGADALPEVVSVLLDGLGGMVMRREEVCWDGEGDKTVGR